MKRDLFKGLVLMMMLMIAIMATASTVVSEVEHDPPGIVICDLDNIQVDMNDATLLTVPELVVTDYLYVMAPIKALNQEFNITNNECSYYIESKELKNRTNVSEANTELNKNEGQIGCITSDGDDYPLLCYSFTFAGIMLTI